MLTPSIPEGFRIIMTGLGTPLRYFPIRKFNKIAGLVTAIVLFMGSIVLFLYGLYSAYAAYLQHGAAVIAGKLTVPLLVAAGLLLLGLLAGWSTWTDWVRGILLYEKGFVIRSRKETQTWAWTDISSIKIRITRHYTNGIYTGTTHEYNLINHQDEKLRINDAFAKVEELAGIIEQNVFPLLYEPAAQEYNQGKPLVFGPVILSKVGLHFGKKTIPWDEVKEVSLKRGELKVSRKNGGFLSGTTVPAPAIPNLRVLLAIIDQVVGLKTS